MWIYLIYIVRTYIIKNLKFNKQIQAILKTPIVIKKPDPESKFENDNLLYLKSIQNRTKKLESLQTNLILDDVTNKKVQSLTPSHLNVTK